MATIQTHIPITKAIDLKVEIEIKTGQARLFPCGLSLLGKGAFSYHPHTPYQKPLQ